MSELAGVIATCVDPTETHWTIVLDRALRQGLVPPDPHAKNAVLKALGAAERAGLIRKTSTGTFVRDE